MINNLLNQKVVVVHGIWWPEQAKQIKTKDRWSYSLKWQLCPGKVPFPCQLRSQGPKQIGSSEPLCPSSRSEVSSKGAFVLPFIVSMMSHPWFYVGTLWTKWWESLWLAETIPATGVMILVPNHLLWLANDTHLEPYSSIHRISSPPGGNIGA